MQAILLYDRDCGFCRWSAARVLEWDREHRLRPLALQHRAACALLADLEAGQRMQSWHLIDDEGRRYSGGAAFAPLLRLLPGGRPLAEVAARVPGVVDAGYYAVANNRAALGRLLPRGARERADVRIAARTLSACRPSR